MKKFIVFFVLSLMFSGIYAQKNDSVTKNNADQKVEKNKPSKVDSTENPKTVKSAKPAKTVKPEADPKLKYGTNLFIFEIGEATTIEELEADSLDNEIFKLL